MKRIISLLILLTLVGCIKEKKPTNPTLSVTNEFLETPEGIEVGLNLSGENLSGCRYYIFIENERNVGYYGVFKFPDISNWIDEEGHFDIIISNKIIDQFFDNYTHYRIFLVFDFWEGENLIESESEFNPTIRSPWFEGGKTNQSR